MNNPDALKIAALDAADDFMRELNDHITARVSYDRDGPRYAGENPPDQGEVAKAFSAAILAVVQAALA